MARKRWLPVIATCILIVASTAAGAFWWRQRIPDSPFERGLVAYQREDWPAAEKAAREHLKTKRDDTRALLLLARSLYKQTRDDSASAIFDRIEMNALGTEDLLLRGQAFVRSGQPEYAILTWRRGLGTNPNDADTLLELERVFSRMDLLHQAARAATSLSKQAGWKSHANLLLGRIRAEQGDTEQAALAFRRALEQPNDWSRLDSIDHVRKQLIRLLLKLAKPAEARSEIAKLESPNDSETGWLLSRCALQEGKRLDAASQTLADRYRKTNPMEAEPAPYVGEGACAPCHKTEFGTQHASRHARTYWRKEQFAKLPYPEKATPDPCDPKVTHTFENRAEGLEIQTRASDRTFSTIVDYAFGSGDRGLTLVGHDQKDRYYECRLSYYAEPIGWDVTSGHPTEGTIPTEYFPGMVLTTDSVRRCFVCHTTNSFAVMNLSGPEAKDNAIGCERCHGPGANHTKLIAGQDGKARGQIDLAIARPLLASGNEIVALCAQCHSPRGSHIKLAPGGADTIRFQGTTLTWSRCYTESGDALSCVTCHNPHRNAEKKRELYETQCLECHGTATPAEAKKSAKLGRAVRNMASPCPVEPTHNCIECHMPRVKTSVAHAEFTDHYIRVHRPGDLPDKTR